MRIFIAISLDKHIQAKIFHLVEKLEKSGLCYGNFVSKDNLHLTLKFLGNVSGEQISKLEEKLGEISFKVFKVKTGKLGFFPSESHVRVVWLEVLGKVKDIFEKIEEKCLEVGFSKESRDFVSHISLVRVKKLNDKEGFMKFFEENRLSEMEFEVKKFSLIKSELTSKGPIHRVIQDFKVVKETQI
tara:strand:- start:39 stop:596 length:558 start_codon:yes stop_codon:yes gene_type:complete